MPLQLGIVLNEEIEAYHACASISHSRLHYFAENFPSDYHAKYIARTAEKEEHKPHFDFGHAVEARCISEAEFRARVAVSPYDEFRTNESKAWRRSQWAAGRVVMKSEEAALVQKCFEAIMRNRDARAIIEGATPQVTFRAQVGAICLQARSDFWAPAGVRLPSDGGETGPLDADLKTTDSLHDFEPQAINLGYDHAAVFYRAVIRLVLARLGGVPEDELPFVRRLFIAVDKSQFPQCTVYSPTDELLDIAEREVMGTPDEPGLLPRLISHYVTNNWPGAPERGVIKAPYWKRKKANA